MQDEYLLARYAGCLLLGKLPELELVNFAEKELVYLDALVRHRPWLEPKIRQLEELVEKEPRWMQASLPGASAG